MRSGANQATERARLDRTQPREAGHTVDFRAPAHTARPGDVRADVRADARRRAPTAGNGVDGFGCGGNAEAACVNRASRVHRIDLLPGANDRHPETPSQ